MNETLSRHMASGIALAKEGKWVESVGYFKLVLDEEPGNTDAWFNVAKACYELKDYPYVIYCLTQVQHLEGKDEATLDMIGDSYYYMEHYDMAAAVYEEALGLNSNAVFHEKIAEARRSIESCKPLIEQNQLNARKWAEGYYKLSILVNDTAYSQEAVFKEHLYYEQIYRKLIQIGKPLSSIKVLDLGCGEGKVLRHFLEWKVKPENLYGIDVSPFIIEHAKGLSSTTMHFTVGSLDELPYDNEQFDFVISRGVLQHITNPTIMNKTAAEIQRVLKKDGSMIFFESLRSVFAHQFFNETTVNRDEEDYRRLFPAYQIVCQPALLNDPYIEANNFDMPKLYKEAFMPGSPHHLYQFVYMNL